jgi:hypothetical protein
VRRWLSRVPAAENAAAIERRLMSCTARFAANQSRRCFRCKQMFSRGIGRHVVSVTRPTHQPMAHFLAASVNRTIEIGLSMFWGNVCAAHARRACPSAFQSIE